MTWTLAFDPLLAPWLIALLAGVAGLAGVIALRRRAGLRLLAVVVLAAALANPALVRQEREPLPDVVVLAVDDSESLDLAGRRDQAEAAADAVRAAVEADPGLDLVEVRTTPDTDGTRLFDAVARGLGDAPRDRLAAVVAVTDGQIHDTPADPERFGLNAPFHALIVGERRMRDRRLEVLRAPPFGIVGERVSFSLKVEDPGAPPGDVAEVSLSLDGADPITAEVEVGREARVEIQLSRRGANVVQIAVAPSPDELTQANNATAVSVAGVRDRLRVLLVTGEPHAGARAWRDLLKSDPSVDLVHFTILRPPEKNDATPIDELSLIEFPTRELFERKLEEFDLVIFDRYKQRGVLQPLYLENIARYVEDGGALLIAAGPPFAGPRSLNRTNLSAVLPALPTGDILEEGFRPAITEVGRAHPVTAGLGGPAGEAGWGRWFRLIDAAPISGDILLEGPRGRPLLMLDRVGTGRVALVLSDHAWLWARGVEGGGPYAELFRRLAHWLMREPELEEELLTASVNEGRLEIARRTMGETPEPAEIVAPSGARREASWRETGPGRFTAALDLDETGLHRVLSEDLSAVAAAGALNPRELADLTPTSQALEGVIAATGGGAFFLEGAGAGRVPDARRTRADADQAGRGWMGWPRREAYAAGAEERRPLAPALLALALVMGLMTLAWAREGR